MNTDISIAGWKQVATYTKTKNKKLRDTFRIFVNQLGWCKGHSDKTGKDFYFESLDALLTKVEALKKIRFHLATGSLPTEVVNRFSATD